MLAFDSVGRATSDMPEPHGTSFPAPIARGPAPLRLFPKGIVEVA